MKEKEMTDLEKMRHSLAHVLAIAVKELFPEAKVGIGPPIKDGFYYDFYRTKPFVEKDLVDIENQMHKVIKRKESFVQEDLPIDEAVRLFSEKKEIYKVELIHKISQKTGTATVSIYRTGDFFDLCRGPHLASTKDLGAFKLTNIAGAYWLGNENNVMMQRIYAVAFPSQKELRICLARRIEAKKRDHRILGKQADLFSIHEKMGQGLILYHPKGLLIRKQIEQYQREEHLKRGYQEIMGPPIMNTDVWKTSGHHQMGYPMYFFDIDGQEYGIKPMNCPAHIFMFQNRIRSYRELPLRFFEMGNVCRYEKSGVLHGLMRTRAFTQDDAHIFCLKEQLTDEIVSVIQFIQNVLLAFGFDSFEIELSTQPQKFIGTPEIWEESTVSLKNALKKINLPYVVQEGEGAFYGPKIDIKLSDALDRVWQCSTIQCDFALPERFDLSYIGSDGKKHRPVMLHRAIMGSLERFLGILIEHYAGRFPLWLAPVQVVILPIAERHHSYAEIVCDYLKQENIRVECDNRNEKIGLKIRDARNFFLPYMLIVGDRECEQNIVSVRKRGSRESQEFSLDLFCNNLKCDIKNKSLD